jgi:hypothetical protein
MTDSTTEPLSLADWCFYLRTYQPGEVWGVWADQKRVVHACRKDDGAWATPIGHASEDDLRARGWIRVDGVDR